MTTLGEHLRIDDRTILVLGQVLDVAHDQPDVANAVVHRVGDTLVLVDTGVTDAFRAALKAAIAQVGDFSRALVLTTHGHVDHIGNNDLADELGVPVEHFLPDRDLDQMRDPAGYWVQQFSRLVGVVPLAAPPSLAGNKVASLFQPLRPFGATTRAFEELPLERIRIGSVRSTGWTFLDGAVRVLRSQGHCAGHVIVHLRDNGVLHLSDEDNGPCAVMADSDQLKIQTTLSAALTLFQEGEATILTDGHTFKLRRKDEAEAFLDTLLEQGLALHKAALGITEDGAPIRPSAFTTRYAEAVAALSVGGANPNEMFAGLMAINQLREIGLRPEDSGADQPWSRAALENPAPVAGMPHGIAILPAALKMLEWKLQGRDHAPESRS